MPRLLLCAAAVSLFALPGLAAAEDCTYADLHGTFTVTVDCQGLKDHSNLGNEQKRLWLAGDWGQVNILEVPSPYKQDAEQIDFIMSNLGRVYTERRSPGGIQETTVAGQEARVVLEHKMRTSSRSWVFNWEGRNLIMRAVAFGKKKARMERLDAISSALTSTFVKATAVADAPVEEERPKVRDRKMERKQEEEAAEAAAAEAAEEAAATAPPEKKEKGQTARGDKADKGPKGGEKAEDDEGAEDREGEAGSKTSEKADDGVDDAKTAGDKGPDHEQ